MQNEFPSMAIANLANLAKFEPAEASISRFSQKSHSHTAEINFSKPESQPIPRSLERAALDLCDSYGDSPLQKAAMLADIGSYPPEQWAWLEAYLSEKSYRMDLERIKPMVRCCDCSNATITSGIASCGAGVESGLPVAGFWATDRHLCAEYQGAEVRS